MKVYSPPDNPDIGDGRGVIFLAGAIDNGEAEAWQGQLLREFAGTDYVFLNPRRDDWNSNLRPRLDEPDFVAQVKWEMDYLEMAETIIFYFPASSRAPITLLELGAFGTAAKGIVYCPDDYYRSGNVQYFARRRGLALFTDRDEMVRALGGTPTPRVVVPDKN